MPDFKVQIRARLAEMGLSPLREAEIVEELSQHLEEEYEQALSCGISDDEARQQVLEQLNTSDLLRRELRDVEHRVSAAPVTLGTEEKVNIFADLWQDLRYALRTLAEEPGFHEHRYCCDRARHWRKYCNLQRSECRAVAAAAV